MASKTVTPQYPTISTGTWIAFGVAMIVIMILYTTKYKPIATLLVVVVIVGILLRFEPQVVSQFKAIPTILGSGGTKTS